MPYTDKKILSVKLLNVIVQGRRKGTQSHRVTFQGLQTISLWLCIFHESNNSSLATWKMALF
jgi:hypothetical protein